MIVRQGLSLPMSRLPLRSLLLAVLGAATLWLLTSSPVLAGKHIEDGNKAYWDVETEVKTNKPAYISVNIKARYYKKESVEVECADGWQPDSDGKCRTEEYKQQETVPPLKPKTVMKEVIPLEVWDPVRDGPRANPNIGADPPRFFCANGQDAKIKIWWVVRLPGVTLDNFWTGDCQERVLQICDIHANFNGLLVGRERDYCPTPLVEELYRTFPYPTISLGVNPPRGLVAEPTWLWAEGYRGEVMINSACLERAPICVAVKVTPRQSQPPYVWSVGVAGAAPLETKDLGQAYPAESPVQFTYERDSSRVPEGYYPITLSISWDVTWHLATEQGGEVKGFGHATELPSQTRQYPGGPEPGGGWISAPLQYEVIEVRSVLVY